MTYNDALRLLGLSGRPTEADVNSAFRKLAKTCHPDLHRNDPAAEAAFKRLTAARDALLQNSARAQSNQARPNQTRQTRGMKTRSAKISEAMRVLPDKLRVAATADFLAAMSQELGILKLPENTSNRHELMEMAIEFMEHFVFHAVREKRPVFFQSEDGRKVKTFHVQAFGSLLKAGRLKLNPERYYMFSLSTSEKLRLAMICCDLELEPTPEVISQLLYIAFILFHAVVMIEWRHGAQLMARAWTNDGRMRLLYFAMWESACRRAGVRTRSRMSDRLRDWLRRNPIL